MKITILYILSFISVASSLSYLFFTLLENKDVRELIFKLWYYSEGVYEKFNKKGMAIKIYKLGNNKIHNLSRYILYMSSYILILSFLGVIYISEDVSDMYSPLIILPFLVTPFLILLIYLIANFTISFFIVYNKLILKYSIYILESSSVGNIKKRKTRSLIIFTFSAGLASVLASIV